MLTWLWTCNTGHNKLTTRKAYHRSSSIMIVESNVVFKPSISLSSFWFSWYPFCISTCNATFINNVKRVLNQCRLTSSEHKKWVLRQLIEDLCFMRLTSQMLAHVLNSLVLKCYDTKICQQMSWKVWNLQSAAYW